MKIQPALLLLSALAATAAAEPIAIINPGFEADSLAGPGAPVFETRPTAATGWNYVEGTGGLSGLLDVKASGTSGNATFYPATASGYEGSRTCFFYQDGAVRQTLTTRLLPNTTYTLSVASGTRLKGAFGGYTITLDTTSGALVGTWTGMNRNIAKPGTFADTSRSFTTGSKPAGAGEFLRITLAQGSGKAGGDDYTDLDNVRLTAEPATPWRDKTPIDVFFVAGQSNAHGWTADAAALSPANRRYADAPDPRALLAYRQRNLPDPADCTSSMGRLGVQGAGFAQTFSGFGPELSLGTDLAKGLNGRVALVKYAIGSAGLEQNFRKASPTGQPHYEAMLSMFRGSIDELRKQGFEPRLNAFFWLQGETDGMGVAAPRYGENMTKFIADLRADLAAPQLKFFLTEINAEMPALKPKPGVAQVNEGMKACEKADPLVRFIPSSDITTGFSDAIHYSADQQIEIGQRWAKAFRRR